MPSPSTLGFLQKSESLVHKIHTKNCQFTRWIQEPTTLNKNLNFFIPIYLAFAGFRAWNCAPFLAQFFLLNAPNGTRTSKLQNPSRNFRFPLALLPHTPTAAALQNGSRNFQFLDSCFQMQNPNYTNSNPWVWNYFSCSFLNSLGWILRRNLTIVWLIFSDFSAQKPCTKGAIYRWNCGLFCNYFWFSFFHLTHEESLIAFWPLQNRHLVALEFSMNSFHFPLIHANDVINRIRVMSP